MNFTITLSEETSARLKAAADADGCSVSEFFEKYSDAFLHLWQSRVLEMLTERIAGIVTMPRKNGYSLSQEQCAEMERRLFR